MLAQHRPTTLVAPNPPVRPIPHLAVHAIPLPTRPPREIMYQARLFRALLSLSRAHRPDVLYHRAASFNLGVLLAARVLGIPCVMELNGLPAMEYALQHRGVGVRARTLFYTLVARLEHRIASGLTVVTQNLATIARRNGARHVLVTRNGVDPAAFVPGERDAARRSLGIADNAEVVGYVGSFTSWQGLDTLIEGATLLVPQRPDLHVLLVGDGPERERLQHLAAPIANHVQFTGCLSHERIAQSLAACDILAAPFAPIERNQRMGISALKLGEYLGMGRPLLGSRLSGMEFIEEEAVGMLFEAGNANALAVALNNLLSMAPDEQTAMGHRARTLAETTYSWQQVVAELIAFVEGF